MVLTWFVHFLRRTFFLDMGLLELKLNIWTNELIYTKDFIRNELIFKLKFIYNKKFEM